MATGPDFETELLRLLLTQGQDFALVLLDPTGRVTHWLMGAESVFGYTAAEAVGKEAGFLFTPEDTALGLERHEMAVADSVGKAGTRIWVTGVLTALRNPAGTVVGYGKVMRDRTDLRAQIDTLAKRAEA